MFGSHPTAAWQFLRNDNKREQDLKEEIEGRRAAELSLSLKTGQKKTGRKGEKTEKLEGKFEVMSMQGPNPPDTAQIRAITSPEEWVEAHRGTLTIRK